MTPDKVVPAVRSFADNLIEYARDRYGPKQESRGQTAKSAGALRESGRGRG